MFTPGQVSEMLQIPASSLSRYARIFANHLSPAARKRKRQYTDQDILTLKNIRDLAGQGLTVDQIADRLDIVVDTAQPENAQALLPNVLEGFENITQTQRAQQEQLDQLRADIARLADELEQQRQPWYKRLRRRKG